MTFNWQDIVEASTEVVSELLLTSILVLILVGLGIILGLWSHRRHRRSSRDDIGRVGLRRRIRQPERYDSYEEDSWFTEFLQGISTEMMGAVVTTLLFGVVMLVFQQYQSTQERQTDLFLQMGSPLNIFAVEASRQVAAEGWLYDGSLDGVNLRETNLDNADLEGADLRNVNFEEAELENTNLYQANLTGANLRFADLEEAFLGEANLQNALLTQANLLDARLGAANLQQANLRQANLQNSNLRQSNLQGADFTGADLSHANLTQADMLGINLVQANLSGTNLSSTRLQDANLLGIDFDEETVLPDGTTWAYETDMARFTDPNHAEFWNPCTELSFAPWYCAGE